MIKNIVKPSINYFNTRESKPLSSLSKIVNNINKVIDETCNKIFNNTINNKEIKVDNSLIKENISSIISLSEDYFSSVSEVDIKLNSFKNNNINTSYINENELSILYNTIDDYNNSIGINLKINNTLYENQNYDNIIQEYNKLKDRNIEILKNVDLNNMINNYSSHNLIEYMFNLSSYLNNVDYYNNIITENKFTLNEYINHSFNILENNIKSLYYKLILDECTYLNNGTNYSTINKIHNKYIDKIEEKFINEIKDISDNVKKYINNCRKTLKETINNVELLDDDFIFEIRENVDHIALSRYLNNTNLDLSMDMINEFSINEDELFLNGNEYSKNNLLEFLNNTINSIDELNEKFDQYIMDINYNLIEFETIKNGELFENDEIFLFSLNKYVPFNEISKLKVEKSNNINFSNMNNNKNIFESIFEYIGEKPLKDEYLNFNYNEMKKYEDTYNRKMTTNLNEFLLLKYRFLNGRELPIFESINNLTSKYDDILPKNLIPLDLLKEELICQNNEDNNIISFNIKNKQTKNITNSIQGYIKLINDGLL